MDESLSGLCTPRAPLGSCPTSGGPSFSSDQEGRGAVPLPRPVETVGKGTLGPGAIFGQPLHGLNRLRPTGEKGRTLGV